MAKVKILNRSGRTISGVDGFGKDFKSTPGDMIDLDAPTAERLLSLYPEDLQDMNAAIAAFKELQPAGEAEIVEAGGDDLDETHSWEAEKVGDIKTFLTEKGVAFNKSHKKPALAAFADALGDDEAALEKASVDELQLFLAANGVAFESDANKPRLIEQAKDFLLSLGAK